MPKDTVPSGELAKKIYLAADYTQKYLLLGFGFLLPLFFLPITFEFFSFNKLVLFYGVAFLSLLAWAIKMVTLKTVYIKRSFLDVPLLLILLASTVSALFSENKYYAFLGNQGSWELSLLSILTGYLYFYTISSNLQTVTVTSFLKAAVLGAGVSALVALPGILGLDFLRQTWTAVVFNTFGSLSGLAYYSSIAAVISMGLLLETESTKWKAVLSITTSVLIVPIIIVGQLGALITLIVGSGLVLVFISSKNIKESAPFIGSILATGLIVVVLAIVPSIRRSVGITSPLPLELSPSLKTSWIVTSSILGERPFFGAGVNNFQSSYSRFKPAIVNYEDTWNTRFGRANNEFINIIATTGVVGLLAWIYLAVLVTKSVFKGGGKTSSISATEEESSEVKTVVAVATFVVILSFVFRTVTLPVSILLFSLLGFLAVSNSESKDAKKESPELPPAVLIGVVALVSGVFYFVGRAYAADYYFRSSINDLAQGGVNTYNLQRMAVTLNPLSDLYRSNYAQSSLALANAVAQKENLTESDKADIQQLVSQSIREARVLTEVLSPLNVEAWEVRGSIYRSLNQVAENAPSWAASAYNTAIGLDPNNPRLRLDLGGMYFAAKDYQNAAVLFDSAVRLKNDYANAHYNLAQAYKQLGDVTNTITELEIVQRLVPQDSNDYSVVEEELKPLRQQAQAQAQTGQAVQNKPSVEQLEAKGTQPTSNQQPLTNPEAQQQLPTGIELEENANE